MVLAFDTLKYAKTLEDAGLTREQAEGLAKAHINALRVALKEVIKDNSSTKDDIEKIHKELKLDIALINQNIETLRKETKTDIALIKKDIEALRQESRTDRALIRKDMKIQALVAIGSLSGVIIASIGIATTILLHFIK